MTTSLDLINYIGYLLLVLTLFTCVIYGQIRILRYGRPVYYQFILLGLLCSACGIFYDLLSVFLFEDAWYGFTLSYFVQFGSSLFFLGAVTEFFVMKKQSGEDCSLINGFGLSAVLLSLLPVMAELLLLVPITKVNTDPVDMRFVYINVFFVLLYSYPAALLFFHKDARTGCIRPFRSILAGIVLFKFLLLVVYYLSFLWTPWLTPVLLITAAVSVAILINLERGNG